jgi:MFS family permease
LLGPLRKRIAAVAEVAPRTYWYVWWGTLVNRLGSFAIPLLTIYLTTDRGMSVSDAGGVVSIFGLGQVFASIIGGQMSDRLGRRITMTSSLFGGAIAMIGLAFARDELEIAVMVGVVGFVGELYRPAVAAVISDVIPPEHRVQAFGLLHWVINIGFAIAAIAGGLLADVDYTILFIVDAATMAIYGAIILIAVPETRPARLPINEVSAPAPSKSWIFDAPFVTLVLISFALTLLPVQSGAPLAAHMTWQDFTSSAFGFAMSINGILIIVLQPWLAAWAAERDGSRVMSAAWLFYGAGFALHGVAPDHWVYGITVHCVAVAIWTLGEILESPVRSALVASLAPADARGRYQGATVMAWGAAFFVGPRLGTWLWEHAGPTVLWASCLGLGIAGAFVTIATAPARRRAISARFQGSSSDEP